MMYTILVDKEHYPIIIEELINHTKNNDLEYISIITLQDGILIISSSRNLICSISNKYIQLTNLKDINENIS